jgi:hypothetical protein
VFNFIFLNYFKKQSVFCVLLFIITNFNLSQANTVIANNSDNSYKNKIYSNFNYIDINSDINIMLYGIGMETKVSNNAEILCGYTTGNLHLKKINKQKSADKSQIVTLSLKQHYNDFVLQYDFSYAHIVGNFKMVQNKTYHSITGDTNTTVFTINLGKNFALNDNLYLFPKCSVVFDKVETKIEIETAEGLQKQSYTAQDFIIIPELVVASELLLTNIKLNPEISFSYLFDTSDSSHNKLNIKPKIIMAINRFYASMEAKSITESHGRSFLIKLGVLF